MGKNCLPIVIPTVDDSELECGECGEMSTACVFTTAAIPYWSIAAGSTLETILAKILTDYKKKVKRIADLEAALAAQLLVNADFESRIADLEP